MNERAAQEFFARHGIDAGRADVSVLTAAYRALAKKLHPDRGGSAEEMKDLNRAYDVLKGTRNIGQGSDGQERSRQERQEREQAAKEQKARRQAEDEKGKQERAQQEQRSSQQQQSRKREWAEQESAARKRQQEQNASDKARAKASISKISKIGIFALAGVLLLWFASKFVLEKIKPSSYEKFACTVEHLTGFDNQKNLFDFNLARNFQISKEGEKTTVIWHQEGQASTVQEYNLLRETVLNSVSTFFEGSFVYTLIIDNFEPVKASIVLQSAMITSAWHLDCAHTP